MHLHIPPHKKGFTEVDTLRRKKKRVVLIKKQIEKTGLISANRNNKATLQLTIPGSFKSSTNDLIPAYLKL